MSIKNPRLIDSLSFRETLVLCETLITAGLVEQSTEDGNLYLTSLGEDYIASAVEDFEPDSEER